MLNNQLTLIFLCITLFVSTAGAIETLDNNKNSYFASIDTSDNIYDENNSYIGTLEKSDIVLEHEQYYKGSNKHGILKDMEGKETGLIDQFGNVYDIQGNHLGYIK